LDVKYIYKYRSRVSTQLGQSFINALNVVSVYLLKLWNFIDLTRLNDHSVSKNKFNLLIFYNTDRALHYKK